MRMSTDLEARFCVSGWSEEHDGIPLRLRLNMLRTTTHNTDRANVAAAVSESGEACKSRPEGIFVDQKEDEHLSVEERTSMKLCISSSKMLTSDTRVNVVRNEQLNSAVGSLNWTSSDVPGSVEVPLQDSLVGSNNVHLRGTKVKHETSYEFDTSLDNIVLARRRRMLLSRKLLQSSRSAMPDEGHDGEPSKLHKKNLLQGANSDMQESGSVQDVRIAENIESGLDEYENQASIPGAHGTSLAINKSAPTLSGQMCGRVSIESGASSGELSFQEQEINVTNADAIGSLALSLLTRVKDEPVDVSESFEEKNGRQHLFSSELLPVKSELKSELELSEFIGDKLDHVPLIDRMKLISSGKPSLDATQNLEFHAKNVASDQDVGTDVLESVKPIAISRPRKRRRTATDSAEVALEEDAPGLLKVLMERGVSAEEIKLYGEGESEDGLEDSVSEDSFAELEAVISQLFSQRQPFMKFPILRCAKGAKASYCLSCLLSLVEQTRYLRLRKWPVEWGWCRDLQSFIFVFRRHNRIVLERPEYGFATYFFELLDSVPVDWQIKRLVTAMKLTSCGRITLIENKPLMVGEDLSDGEAQVLAEFGWIPNTGLGTMLNYCDRVVHDRKQEKDSSEWRSKIAKQLINGYNGGNIVSKGLPKKLLECQGSLSENIRVKLEQ